MNINVRYASSFGDKLFGLLKKTNKPPMLFHTHFGIHTLFMSYPLDVLVLNSNRKIVKIKESLQPNKLFFYNLKYSLVLELKQGFVKKNKLHIGDKIELIS